MARYQIFLIGRGTLAYEIKNLGSITIDKNTPISPMPLPEEDSEENMLVKIEGNSTTVNISWALIESTNCVGSYPLSYTAGTGWAVSNPKSDIVSSIQQMDWLESTFSPNSISDYYSLLIVDSSNSSSTNSVIYSKNGTFQGFNFNTDSGSPVIWNATLNFIEGSVISTLSGNTHEAGSITGATWGAGSPPNSVNVSFKEFLNYLTSDRPVTTGAVLRYKKTNDLDFWHDTEITFSANTTSPYDYTKTFNVSVISGKKYTFKVAFNTDGGRGEWSPEFNFSTAVP